MTIHVHTTGKVSKAKGVSVAAAVIEGLPEGTVKVDTIHRPNHPTPNSCAMEALALGIGVAIAKGATELVVYSSSKNVVRAVDGTGGAKYETRRDAILAAWVIYWRSGRVRVGFEYRAAKDMPNVVEHAATAINRADAEPLTPAV